MPAALADELTGGDDTNGTENGTRDPGGQGELAEEPIVPLMFWVILIFAFGLIVVSIPRGDREDAAACAPSFEEE